MEACEEWRKQMGTCWEGKSAEVEECCKEQGVLEDCSFKWQLCNILD